MNYNEIIQEIARERLIPLGVFQKGRSRCFIDDNGWFFTVVEFQPSAAKGTYLNVAMHFLWKSPLREYLSFDYAVNGSRVKGLLVYENEHQFRSAFSEYVDEAEKHILFYRSLRDREAAIAYAKKMTKRRIFTAYPHGSEIWAEFINLSEDSLNANVAAARQYWSSKPSMKNMRLNESQSEQLRVF